MALAARTHKMTAEEFFALPDDELPHPQLIDGELVVNSPALGHQRIIVRLLGAFLDHLAVHPQAGEMGLEINTLIDVHDVYKPDLWWVPPDRVLDDADNLYDPPPPLVVEVRSPSTWHYDTGVKLRRYETAGVAEVWLVDGEGATVRVHRRSRPDVPTFDLRLDLGPGDTLATPLIPGWEVDLEALLHRR